LSVTSNTLGRTANCGSRMIRPVVIAVDDDDDDVGSWE